MPRVFISSLIIGMEEMRDAAEAACSALDIDVIMAEDFAASPGSPRGACLQGVTVSDGIILLLGETYGYVQASGLSATEEEFREATRLAKDVLVFRTTESHEPEQQEFLSRVGDWGSGRLFKAVQTPMALQREVTRALLGWSSAPAAEEVDHVVIANIKRVLPEVHAGMFSPGGPWLAVSWAPTQRRVPDEDYFFEQLPRRLADLLVAGEHRLLSSRPGIQSRSDGLVLSTTSVLGEPGLSAWIGIDDSVAIGCEVVAPGGDNDRDTWTNIHFLDPRSAGSTIGRMLEFLRGVQEHLDPDRSIMPGRMQSALALLGMRHFSLPFTQGGGIPIRGFPADGQDPIFVPTSPEPVVRSQLVADGDLVSKVVRRLERASKEDPPSGLPR